MALADGVRTVEVGGGPMLVTDLAGRAVAEEGPTWLRVLARNGGVEVRGRTAPGLRLTPANGRPLRFHGREYAGTFEILPNGGGLVLVNELGLEEYVAGSVKAEAGDQMPLEMLKAQAIAARTYAAYHRQLNVGKPYHLLASTMHQQYAGRVEADSPVWMAVRDTEGQVLHWDGALFPAFYHSDSGGHTEDPRRVFSTGNMPPLRSVRATFASTSPHSVWRLDLPLETLGALLRRGGVAVGGVTGLDVLERSPSLRVSHILVRGTAGSVSLRGNEFRRLVGYDTLKSTLFAVAVAGPVARFTGRGYGHGVGLDQWGAKAMADLGYRAPDIIDYYYPGAVLTWLRSAALADPLGSPLPLSVP